MIASPDIHTTALDALEALPVAQRLALAAKLRDLAMRDDSYQETPIGRHIARYKAELKWRNLHPHTIADREGVLRRLALEFAHLTIEAFEGRDGGKLLFKFLADQWGDKADGTRAHRVKVFRDFFNWAVLDGLIDRNPTQYIAKPKVRTGRRDAHPEETILRLIAAQPARRDRVALMLFAREALRKSEVAGVQLGHFDFNDGTVAILGKGSKFAVVKLFPHVAREAEMYAMERAAAAPNDFRTEFLLYGTRVVRRGSYPDYWYDEQPLRHRQPSTTWMHKWFKRCLERAGLADMPLHEMRHTAGTRFHATKARGDVEMTRQFMRHERIETTAGYIHVPSAALAALKRDDEGES